MIFGRTELIIGGSRATNCEESFAEVRFCVAPRKPREIAEKHVFEPEQNLQTKFSGVQTKNVGNRLKRILAKFWRLCERILRGKGMFTENKVRKCEERSDELEMR